MKQNIFIRGVDRSIWDEFRMFVAQKYGKLHGVLGKALTEALVLYMKNCSSIPVGGYANTYMSIHSLTYFRTECRTYTKPRRDTKTKVAEITCRIINESKYEIPEERITSIIAGVAGRDPRTIRKYLKLLRQYGILTVSRISSKTNKYIYNISVNEAKKIIEEHTSIREPRYSLPILP